MRWRDPLVYFQVFGVCAVQFLLSSSCGVFQERSSLKAFNNHTTRWPIQFYVCGGRALKSHRCFLRPTFAAVPLNFPG